MFDCDKILKNIQRKAKELNHSIRIMELCGTHAEAIAENGIKNLMPKNLTLVSGPGCPVCVTDQSDIDIMVGLALAKVPVAVYGDAVAVPGSVMSLEEARRIGADVNIVYDISEAVEMKKEKSGLVFFGLGFETTTGMTAWAIKNNLIVYSAHKLFPPAMEALLKNKKIRVDGFINPGHVSAIIGTEIYAQFEIPQVIAGFTGEDVLLAIDKLLSQIICGEKKVENAYKRLVKKEGNPKARKLISEVFEVSDAKWRGFGNIKNSGLEIRKKYRECDAEFVYRNIIEDIKKNIKPKFNACRCGEVLQGMISPNDCPLFGKVCNPDNPQGACMVSREGSCSIQYKYANECK